MKMHWTDVAAITVLAGAGCAAIYAGLQRSIRRAVAERQQSTERQIAALAATVKALQARVAELNRQEARGQEVPSIEAAAEGAQTTELVHEKPEMLAVITAAATAFLGKTARVRSAKLMPAPQETVSPWTQQGRMIVQTSHNLRTRE